MRESEESEKERICVGGKKGARDGQPPGAACAALVQRKAGGPRRHRVSPRSLRTPSGCAPRRACDGLQGTFPAGRARWILRRWQWRCERGCSSLKLHPQKDPLETGGTPWEGIWS